jgi:hypothetical protein
MRVVAGVVSSDRVGGEQSGEKEREEGLEVHLNVWIL